MFHNSLLFDISFYLIIISLSYFLNTCKFGNLISLIITSDVKLRIALLDKYECICH